MTKKMLLGRPKGFFESFERRPGPIKTNMHFCPGCGHGILHKLIAEAISDLDMQEDVVILAPVGCSVFAYYYFDACGISVPHGRAPSVGTGIVRANPDKLAISYQGDGDLGAIGFNDFIQAANRGENMTVCFLNNAVYGMTGGQMAPTTLPGQVTTTSPYGRSITNEGYPLKVSEMVAALDSPVYVERVALTSTKHIMKARQSLRKAFTYMKEKRGFSLVEFLGGCPINLKMSSHETDLWIEKSMFPYFPLGCFKDIAAERSAIVRPHAIFEPETVKSILFQPKSEIGKSADFRNKSQVFEKEKRIKCAGFGGQGILSLGLMIAFMGQLRNFNVTWLPSYGPEMRGGTAHCSVVLSRNPVGSPIVMKDANLLIAMNQPSLDKFMSELKGNTMILFDSTNVVPPKTKRRNMKIFAVPATQLAKDIGNIKVANSIVLGALSLALFTFLEGDDKQDFDAAFEEAIIKTFKQQKLIDLNLKAFRIGKGAVKEITF